MLCTLYLNIEFPPLKPDPQASLDTDIIVGGLGVTTIAQMSPSKGDTHKPLIRVKFLKDFE